MFRAQNGDVLTLIAAPAFFGDAAIFPQRYHAAMVRRSSRIANGDGAVASSANENGATAHLALSAFTACSGGINQFALYREQD